jgi:hypothetical protein
MAPRHPLDRHQTRLLILVGILVALMVAFIAFEILRADPQQEGGPTFPTSRRVLSTGFESVPVGPVTPSEFRRVMGGGSAEPDAYDDSSIVKVPGRGHVIRTYLEAGTIRSNPEGNNGVAEAVALPRALTHACLSYDLRFDVTFDWAKGGKLPGLSGVAPGLKESFPSGGRKPGDLGWSGRVMWLGPAVKSMPGRTNEALSYMYGPTQQGQFGDNLFWNTSFARGTWHRVKQCYDLNHVDKQDGRLRAWLDGRLVLDRTGYTFRTRQDVDITALDWSVFRGGGTLDWASSQPDWIDIDNVSITGT